MEDATARSVPEINVSAYDGCFQAMPAYAEDAGVAAVKLVNTFPHNIKNDLTSIPAEVLLMDGKTGYFLALMDGAYVTQLRTGAASGAAFDILANKNVEKGAVITGDLPGRENEEEIIIFKSVGIGIQDLTAAKGIYDAALRAGVGLRWGADCG